MYSLTLLVGLKQYMTKILRRKYNEITLSIFMQQSEVNHTQHFFRVELKYLLSSLPKLTDVLPCTVAGERP